MLINRFFFLFRRTYADKFGRGIAIIGCSDCCNICRTVSINDLDTVLHQTNFICFLVPLMAFLLVFYPLEETLERNFDCEANTKMAVQCVMETSPLPFTPMLIYNDCNR